MHVDQVWWVLVCSQLCASILFGLVFVCFTSCTFTLSLETGCSYVPEDVDWAYLILFDMILLPSSFKSVTLSHEKEGEPLAACYYYEAGCRKQNNLNKYLNVANCTRKTSFPNICYMLLNLLYHQVHLSSLFVALYPWSYPHSKQTKNKMTRGFALPRTTRHHESSSHRARRKQLAPS